MRQILTKHLSDKDDKKAFETWWRHSGRELETFARALLELAGDGRIKEDDLRGVDVAVLLAFRAGKREAYLDVLDMLPEAATQNLKG